MPDRRFVDDLSIEELEQILRLKKQEARRERLERFRVIGRRRGDLPVSEPTTGAFMPVEAETAAEPAAPRKKAKKDQILLFIEIGAAAGLIGLMGYVGLTLTELNQDASAAQSAQLAGLPSATPTAILSAVVLPGGHTSPNSPGGAQPNYSEVPDYLRPVVEQQFAGPLILPTPGPSAAIRIRIPAIGVDAPIVQGDGWEQLKMGVAQRIGTGNPGEQGNIVLSAHDDIYGEIFRYLNQLQPGDRVFLQTLNKEFAYEVLYSDIVEPTDVSAMLPSRDPIVTLISCYPYLVNTQRIVVIARLVDG
jgi:sortase A